LLILRGKAEELNLPANQNQLQPPFHEAEIPGDILLQRSDEEGNVLDFTLKHYRAFQKKIIKEWTPADDDAAEGDEEEDDEETGSDSGEEEDEEEEEEDEEEEEEEENKALNAAQIDPAAAQAKLAEFLKDYAEKHNGAMPSDEELNTIKGTIYYMLALEASGGDAFGEEDEDEEEEEEEEEEKVKEEKPKKKKGKK
jgi:hypothetical protein